ncbi:MAG: hypothetical protein JOZ72_01645 [Alphaproteobacteria bacterium]|nr:hypothetical protein [Alphaproteobacteria bacterium]
MSRTAAVLAVLLLVPAVGRAAVNISSAPTKNMACSGAVCTPTAKNAVLNAGDLAAMLAASDVTVKTGAGAATIELTAPLSWAGTRGLTLDANLNVSIKAEMVVEGAGGLAIVTDDGGTGGDLNLFPGGKIDFWDDTGSLVINGRSYLLVRDVASLAAAVIDNPSGNYALSADYDAGPDGAYNGGIVLVGFGGTLEGLGHTISNLHIDGHSSSSAGMFVSAGGIQRDLNLANIDVISGGDAGALSGRAVNSRVINVTVSGAVQGGSAVGGLIGHVSGSNGIVTKSSSSVTVTGGSHYVGGLVGHLEGPLSLSHATGDVMGGKESTTGGLVGFAVAPISQSYATGNVSTHGRSAAGGLVGSTNTDGAPIVDCYSRGSVAAGSTSSLGGLMGIGAVSVSDSYTTSLVLFRGKAPARRPHFGAFIGHYGFGVLAEDYWDKDSSGQSRACDAGCRSGVTGLSDVALKAALPAGFDPAVWGQSAAINDGYPYLLANPPD